MALMTEVAELMKQPGRVYEVAERTQYNLSFNTEDKEIAETLDAWAREIGNLGYDRDHMIAQFISRTVQDELYNAPDELLDVMFNRGSIGEFDDYQIARVPKNTLVAYEAAKGGNVDRSYLNFETVKPTWHNVQVETDLSYVDLRRNGWKSVANLTTYMTEAVRNKQFYIILNAIDAAITGGDQKIDVAGTSITMEAMDALSLYLLENSDGTAPFTVSLMKYCAAMRRMTGYAQYMSDSMKDGFNRYGLVTNYDGIAITGISSAKKLGDGSLLIPDKTIFGFGGRIGNLDQKGEIHVYENHDDNGERVHLMLKDFTFGYGITNLERIAKITLE